MNYELAAPPTTRRLIGSVILLTVSRLVVNTTRRFAYPFLPSIARELNVSLSSVQSVVAVQAGIGASSPIFGPLAERYGRKRIMLAMIALLTLAAVMGAALPRFQVFVLVMLTFGVAKMVFDPALQAYLGDRVPYNRRGLALGTVELSWAGALLVAAPVAGLLLRVSGLSAVFAMIAGLGLVVFGALALYLPPDHPDKGTLPRFITPLDTLRILRASRAALGAVGFTFLLAVANEIFFINYGAWMESAFDLPLESIGAASVAIAAAEVLGEFSVMGMADRFGKRRLALLGAGLSALAYIVLPHLTFSLTAAVAGLFLMFLFVETGIVASIPLFSEILPEARAVMMSSVLGSASAGRLSGAVLGGLLYQLSGNFALMGVISTVIGLAAYFMLWRFVKER